MNNKYKRSCVIKFLKVLAIFVIVPLSHHIMALDFSGSGHEYLAHVTDSDPYMQGIAAGTASTILSVLYYEGIICTPKKITNDQFTAAIMKFLKDNPERLHEQIYVLGADAFVTAFPCEHMNSPR